MDNFKWQTNNIGHNQIWTWLRKGNLKKENESLLIAAENNAIMLKRKSMRQQNSEGKLCGEKDETVYHLIIDCSKLAQKGYKIRHDRVGKGIQ